MNFQHYLVLITEFTIGIVWSLYQVVNYKVYVKYEVYESMKVYEVYMKYMKVYVLQINVMLLVYNP